MSKVSKEVALTAENAMVISKYYKLYNVGVSGYVKDGDALVFMKVVGHVVNFKKGETITCLEDNKGKLYRRTDFSDLFLTKEAFEQNNPASNISYQTFELLRHADIKHLVDCEVSSTCGDDNNNYCYLNVWVFENGEAKRVPLVINEIVMNSEGKWALSDGHIPDKFWLSRTDAYSFNEYKIIDKDGEEFIEEGYQKRLAPTPEQWKIINEMRDLIKKANDAGLTFFFDRDCCSSIKVLNTKNVRDYGYDVESFEGGDLISLNAVCFADTELKCYDWNSCEDEYVISMMPTPRQKKEFQKS